MPVALCPGQHTTAAPPSALHARPKACGQVRRRAAPPLPRSRSPGFQVCFLPGLCCVVQGKPHGHGDLGRPSRDQARGHHSWQQVPHTLTRTKDRPPGPWGRGNCTNDRGALRSQLNHTSARTGRHKEGSPRHPGQRLTAHRLHQSALGGLQEVRPACPWALETQEQARRKIPHVFLVTIAKT